MNENMLCGNYNVSSLPLQNESEAEDTYSDTELYRDIFFQLFSKLKMNTKTNTNLGRNFLCCINECF